MKNGKTALITGASKGFGYSLAENLARMGWRLLINARHDRPLFYAKEKLDKLTEVISIPGDVQNEKHLMEFTRILKANDWKLDLAVNNASTLGITPMPHLFDYQIDELASVLKTNMIAPLSILQKILPHLHKAAKVINISSDAGVEAYETWGAYGASKAGLDHLTAILAKENPQYYFYSFDPGDMRTDMHQAAFPGQDISDRPFPAKHAVPAILQLIENDFSSGRYTVESFKAQLT
ncbi:MAG: SDR family oxidoreductase [Cyclobacteriaceae bacterium]